MATPTTMTDLSVTAASNSPAGSESPTNGDDFLRAIQAIIRRTNAKGSDIASATTTDIGAATAEFVDITGTTTITGLGTIDAGIVRTVRFTGALTLTYNATSLILPGNANITTANGDMAIFRSLGSGNWVCVSYVRRDGTAIIANYLPLTGGTITGDVTFSGATLKLVKGADVASASTLPLITDGNYFDVTGTTTITSFNSMGVGTQIVLHFDAALTLTHNATDLILPGGANITTAAGDEAGFIEYASGDWRCVYYTRASGANVNRTTVSSVAVTSGTSVTISSSIPIWANKITVFASGISTSGTSAMGLQLNSETTSYTTYAVTDGGSPTRINPTNVLPFMGSMVAASTFLGVGYLTRTTGNEWTWSASIGSTNAGTQGGFGVGTKTTSTTLSTISITMVNGTDTFDGGSGQVTLLIEA